ncbi:MAG: RidA family protein [Planctomycetes bacterium]|nr:RidA family protein [Planctomycetota bacterium]
MKQKISTDAAPKAIGPYSQAIRTGGLVYCSGQIALDPKSGEIVGKDVTEQCEQVMKNLSAVLAAAGSDTSKAVKCTVYLKFMKDFAAVNAVYGKYFSGDTPPARATVAVSELPRDVLVEIDCVALVGS